MRHGNKINHLGRTTSHRHATMRNMASSLIIHKRIETTVAKAKELKKFVEPLLTRCKEDNTHNRRIIFSNIPDKEIVKELYSTISDKIADRPGGYTRIIKLGTRRGDNAEMCMMELVDFNETMMAAATEKATKTRRSRRGGKKGGEAAASTAVATPAAVVVEALAPVAAEEATAAVVVEDVTETPQADDIEIVEGIGPKIAQVLADVGITTFAQLAEMTPESIEEILKSAGSNFASKDASTWPKQAGLARDGKFDELKALQEELNGGRE